MIEASVTRRGFCLGCGCDTPAVKVETSLLRRTPTVAHPTWCRAATCLEARRKSFAEASVPSILDTRVIDDVIRIDDGPAYEMTKRLFREEGLLNRRFFLA